MRHRPALPPDVRRVLDLLPRDRAAAAKAMAELGLEQQLALVCEAPVNRRTDLLDLAAAPEALIPLLPEAELCFTVKAVGLESATWLLEYATPEQVVASLDLDVWRGHLPLRANLDAWLEALAATSDQAMLRSVNAIDPELLVHYLKGRIEATMKPPDDEDWQPPVGSQTLDGVFYFAALETGDDLEAVVRMLRLLFRHHYWTYFRMLQGAIHELDTDNQEWAHRWRTGRLEDLGFPAWEEAMGLYVHLPAEERARLPTDERPLDVAEWHLPVWIPSLPEGRDSRHLIFRSIARLEAEERRAAFYAFVAVANKVAVADNLELSDVETTPRAIEKAATWISAGLAYVATENRLDAADVTRRVPLERLFRVGANLDPERARPPSTGGDADVDSGELTGA
jgi:hypothetical protein